MAVAGGVVGESPVCLVANPAREYPECEGIEQYDQHLGAMEAEGAADGGRPLRNPHGKQRQRNRDGIGDHVRGMSQQAEAAGHDAANYLDGHLNGQHDQDGYQGALAGLAQVVSMLMLVRLMIVPEVSTVYVL